nr:TIR domain-containing protein [Candidatus Sigynarchaeota archaeon]
MLNRYTLVDGVRTAVNVPCLTLTGHTDTVNTCAFSPEGITIVSGSRDKTLKLWNILTGQEIRTLEGHSYGVYSCAFSPDGTTIVSASDDAKLKLWNARTGEKISTLVGHSSLVWACAFSRDGTEIVSASSDHTLKLWDARTGKELRTLGGHSSGVTACAFSPDGTTIVSGSEDKTLKLWNARTGEEMRSLKGHSAWVHACAFSPDGTTIVSGSSDKTLILWDALTGKAQRTLAGHSDKVWACAFSPDGATIVSASWDKTLRLWDARTGKEVCILSGHSDGVWTCAFSPDGTRIASGSSDKSLKIWDVSGIRSSVKSPEEISSRYEIPPLTPASLPETDEIRQVRISCPVCKKKGIVDISVLRMNNAPDGFLSELVPKGTCCDHSFTILVDKKFLVRGSQRIDVVEKAVIQKKYNTKPPFPASDKKEPNIFVAEEIPFPAYKGKEAFIFVSYSHDDKSVVYPEILRLHEMGYRIWYDQGIGVSKEWVKEIVKAIDACSFFVVFMSPSAINSIYVKREIARAIKKNKPFLAIFLQPTELPEDTQFEIDIYQHLFKYNRQDDQYLQELMNALPEETKNLKLSSPSELIEALGNSSLDLKNFSGILDTFKKPPRAYSGSEPFIFVSYSHADKPLVFPIISHLQQEGIRIWYDEGIAVSETWRRVIAEKLESCSSFITFLSKLSVTRQDVLNEIAMAEERYNKEEIGFLVIYLDRVDLPAELKLVLSRVQSLSKRDLSDEQFYPDLLSNPIFDKCTGLRKEKTSKYNEIKLYQNECEVLVAVESRIGKSIPLVDEVKNDSFGFNASEGHVTHLGLYNQGLTEISSSIKIENLRSLRKLALRQNSLSGLPASIGQLRALTRLEISSNRLSSLPEGIGELSALRELSISSNHLERIPDTIGKLENLEALDLSNNLLKRLPDTIGDLKSLIMLDLRGNLFQSLPITMDKLVNLKFIDLRGIDSASFTHETTSMLQNLGKRGCLVKRDGHAIDEKSIEDRT